MKLGAMINVILVLVYDISVIMQCLHPQKIIPSLSGLELTLLGSCIFMINLMLVLLLVKHKFIYFLLEIFFILLSIIMLSLPIQRVVDSLSNQ